MITDHASKRLRVIQVMLFRTVNAVDRVCTSSEMGRKHVIYVSDVERAYHELDVIMQANPADAPFHDEDGDASWGPVILCEDTSWSDFERWINRNEGSVRRWEFEPHPNMDAGDATRGRVVIYRTSQQRNKEKYSKTNNASRERCWSE